MMAFVVCGFKSFAQSLNISGGFTSSTLKSDQINEGTTTVPWGEGTYTTSQYLRNVNGFNAFVGYEFSLGNRLSLETGLKLQTRGYKIENNAIFTSSYENTREKRVLAYNLKYIDLPVVLNTAITTGDFRIYARAGIFASILLDARYEVTMQYFSENIADETNEYGGLLNASDIEFEHYFTGGFILGAGAAYKCIYFETNYNLGAFSLKNIEPEAYTHDLSFSLGYKLKFGK
jgi:hypothetical protein